MTVDSQQKLVATALRRLEFLNREESFDPNVPDSRPTPAQQEIIDDFGSIPTQWIVASNRCLAAGTLVRTPTGNIPIEKLSVGDLVYSELGQPIRVLQTFNNGPKEVADLTFRNSVWATCTANHIFQVETGRGSIKEVRVDALSSDTAVRRVWVRPDMGTHSIPDSYAIGALLGDGCSRQPHRYVQISSADSRIPTHVAGIYGNTARKLHISNYTWSIGEIESNLYNLWCKGRYAHQKIADIEELQKWDRDSLIRFVAGLVDTDGSIYATREGVMFQLGMQAKSVIDAFHWAVLSLWGIPLNRTIDKRIKYKNGPVHVAYCKNTKFVEIIMRELNRYILSPQKKWQSSYSTLGGSKTNLDAIGARWGLNRRIVDTYDIHVDSPTNLYLLGNGLVTHNSGKSQTCARLIAWTLMDKHPTWRVPQSWKDEGLFILIAGKNSKQCEESLWHKVRSYLTPGTYKEVRAGNILSKVEVDSDNPEIKHRIIFQSMESVDQARERIQSYDAHIAWGDELIDSAAAVSELRLRVVTKGGLFLCSFTPLKPAPTVRKLVDGAALPHAKRYNLKTLDNPVFREAAAKEKLLATFVGVSSQDMATRLEGDWAQGESNVYRFDYDTMVRMPQNYSPLWRHVESIDPAMSSSMGLTIWAECPQTLKWFCILARYINTTKAPSEVVQEIHAITSRFNIVRRIADTHETWYIREAALAKISYIGVYKKADRKGELIKQYQEKLGRDVYLTPEAPDLIEETQECKWSDRTEGKIVAASKYHLLDSAHYFCDNIPRTDTSNKIQASSWHDWLYQANETRLKKEETQKARTDGRLEHTRAPNGKMRARVVRWR